MKRVLVLGGSGMLGSMVADVLSRDPSLSVTATVRDLSLVPALSARIPGIDWKRFDAETDDPRGELLAGRRYDWIVNAIGVIKPFIRDDRSADVVRALRVNGLFPHRLAAAAESAGCRVIQIATDCVYSGREGAYREDAPHDALDVYGKSKSLGEVRSPAVTHLRCSIVGPEPKGGVSLLAWFLGQPAGASVTGFVNHRWNGVTTLHFGKACAGIVRESPELPPVLPPVLHLVPEGSVTKAELLETFAAVFGRTDIEIRRGEAAVVVDRTLSTADPGLSRSVWRAAGHPEPPTVPAMVAELGAWR